MPWKKDGEKWHLGEKGFPPGKKIKWDRAILPRFIGLLTEINPLLEFKWDVRRVAITIRPPGSSRFWCRLKTKDSAALEAWFVCRRGQINLNQVEGIGQKATIEGDRNDGSEVLKLWFVNAADLQPVKLKALLTEHSKGFQTAFAGDEDEKEAG